MAIRTGERAGSATAVQLEDRRANYVNIKAQASNAGNVYVGISSAVTVAGGTTDDTSGWELDAGQETGWLPCANLSDFFIICDNAGDDIVWMIQV